MKKPAFLYSLLIISYFFFKKKFLWRSSKSTYPPLIYWMPSFSRVEVVSLYVAARCRLDFSMKLETNSWSSRIVAPMVTAADEVLCSLLDAY